MHCKFLNHGIALAYQETVKPCCVWKFDTDFKKEHSLQKINLSTWHQHQDLVNAKNLLENGIWPANCEECRQIESSGRQDSLRLGGLNSYSDYNNDDITLEIRPGSVCNFACQTCWPAASSRVANYHKLAGIPILSSNDLLSSVITNKSQSFQNFNFLMPVATRIKSVVLLGGEPFYDKNCLEFLQWWKKNTKSKLIVFTNGSNLDFDYINSITQEITLVFSIDAVDVPAEYIRYGTKWNIVWANFKKSQSLSNVKTRVNITTSVYNFYYLDKLIDQLLLEWPEVVSFSHAIEGHLLESVVPHNFRPIIIDKLSSTVNKLHQSSVEEGQRWNAINALNSIINDLQNISFDQTNYNKFKEFVIKMDEVKGINIKDYCKFTADFLNL